MNEPIEIVVGVDRSDGASRALQWALAEAAARPARVTAVMAWSYLDQQPEPGHSTFEPGYTAHTADHALHSYLIEAVGDDAARSIAQRTINDLPARALLAAAADADLLVLGTRGLGGFKGLLLGSVAHQLVSHSPCPVVVVPPEG